MKTSTAILTAIFSAVTSLAYSDTFGSGANTFNIAFTTIGNPGNVADTTGSPNPAGSVAYSYRVGTYQISRDMVTKANSIGNLAITMTDMTTFGGNGVNRPATGASWNEAARFVNWLNTSTGSPPAYKFALQPGDSSYSANANLQLWTPSDAGYNPSNLYRNSLANYFLPSIDEWYKAAYYNPTSSAYYDYPTASNTAPAAVASGTAAGTAVYNQPLANGPADITLAGGLSAYGTRCQGGNVIEYEETDFDQVNDSGSSFRGHRGTFWNGPSSFNLSSSNRQGADPTSESPSYGFRVAGIAVSTGQFGDFNNDGRVDAADYVTWRKNGIANATLPNDNGAGNQAARYTLWLSNFGKPPGAGSGASGLTALPEPSTIALGILALAFLPNRRRRSVPRNRV